MPQNTIDKIKKLWEIGDNPRLAVFKVLEEFSHKVDNFLSDAQKQLTETVRAIKEEFLKDIGSEIDKKIQGSVFNKLEQIKGEKGDKGDKGDRGEKGDSIIGPKGEKGDFIAGPQGIQGLQGLPGKDGRCGRDGIDAKTPIFGIDYFTPGQISDIVLKVADKMNMDKLLKKLTDIEKSLEDLKKKERLAGQKTIHRGGGANLAIDELIGTGDNATLGFDLDYDPYDASSIIALHVGGGAMFSAAGDYTLSGKTITFVTAPPTGAKIVATYRKV